ncbi:MAG: exo-beta-N-acetylmuramidase NamZ family protein, partial [Gemmatimonadaceae bacterium]
MNFSLRRGLTLLGIAAAVGCSNAAPAQHSAGVVVPGIEVLLRDSLTLVRGKRVGLITNQSGRDRAGQSDIDLLAHAPGVRLVALFAPEHGIRGTAQAGATIASDTDAATGVPIYSLYGATRAPTPAMLDSIDVLLYDIQDAGARFYTYVWTMALSADAAGRAHIPFVVLDRPDPIRGDRVEGGVLDTAYRSFVGEYPVALRYGLTPGELLKYLVGTGQVHADVHVVPMQGWHRSMWYSATGLPWVNPSPNLRSQAALALYPGTVFFEGTNLSEGRGTAAPFQLVGAGWLTDAGAIARELNLLNMGGVRFDSTSRAIAAGQKWGGDTIPMLHVAVTDPDRVKPVQVAAYMLQIIRRRHAADFKWLLPHMDQLAGSDALRKAVDAGTVAELLPRLVAQSQVFAQATR